jgi:hypothetical protein
MYFTNHQILNVQKSGLGNKEVHVMGRRDRNKLLCGNLVGHHLVEKSQYQC